MEGVVCSLPTERGGGAHLENPASSPPSPVSPGQDCSFPSLAQQRLAMSSFSGQSIGDQLQNLHFASSHSPLGFGADVTAGPVPPDQPGHPAGLPCSPSNNNENNVSSASIGAAGAEDLTGLYRGLSSAREGTSAMQSNCKETKFGVGGMESNPWTTSMFPSNNQSIHQHQQQQQQQQQQQLNQLQHQQNNGIPFLNTNFSKSLQAVSPTSLSSSSLLPKDMMVSWLLDQTQQQQQATSTPSLGTTYLPHQQHQQLQHQTAAANFLQDSLPNSSQGSSAGIPPQQLDVHLHHHHHHHLHHYPQHLQASGNNIVAGGGGRVHSGVGGGVTVININNESIAKANSNTFSADATHRPSFPSSPALVPTSSTATAPGGDDSNTHWVRRVGVFSAVHPFQDGSNSFPFLEQQASALSPKSPTSSLPWTITGTTTNINTVSPSPSPQVGGTNILQGSDQSLTVSNMPYQPSSPSSSPSHTQNLSAVAGSPLSTTAMPSQFLPPPSSLSCSPSAVLPKCVDSSIAAASFSFSSTCPLSPQHHPHNYHQLPSSCSLALQGSSQQQAPASALLIGQSQGQGSGALEETMDLS